MATARIAVRDCADLGLPGWVRLAVPPPAELERVLAALRRAVGR
jgi:histidinol-phosphate/aromatic aminotransferase/cobyric acid decarboxylase-like protein